MKWLKTIRTSLLLLAVTALVIGQTVFAEETDGADGSGYTYTVRLSAGNQGTLTGEGITVVRGGVTNPQGTSIAKKGDQMVVSGLEYNDTVYIIPDDAAKVTDERYSIRGVRRSGRDNTEAVQATGNIASDLDYVIAYRVSGQMVKYTVNYLDADGNSLLASDTYYGNPGERQYVSARYVDGYLPQAYNLVMTLSTNEAENVYNFQYTPVTPPATTVTEEPGDTTTTTTTTTTAGAAGAAGDAGAAGAGAGAAGADAGAGAAGADAGVGGDVVPVPDDAVPQADAPDDVVDLDDEEVPLASMNQERPGKVVSYLPVYIGIGVAAALALAATAVYLRKRRRVPAQEIVEKLRNDEEK